VVASKEIQKLEHSSVRLSLSVAKDDVKKEYQALINQYAKSVQIPGFRKGHVPASILETKFGEGLKQDVMGRIMEKAVQEALEDTEERPLPYSTPTVTEEPHFSIDSDFSFSVSYDVFPVYTVGDYKGIEIEIPKVEIDDSDEKRELEALQDRNAIVKDKDDGKPAEKGDVATVTYCELDDTGAELAGSKREDFVFALGMGQNIYDLDADVIGMRKNEEKIVAKTFPADYAYPEIAGQKKTLKVALTQLKARDLPKLDDDFAQDISEKYKNIEDLKADIRKRLNRELENLIENKKENQVIDALIAKTPIDIPESMIAIQLEGRFREFMGRLGTDEATLLKILAGSGKTKQALFDEWRPQSEKEIKTRLIIEKLHTDLKVEADDSDIEKEYAEIAELNSVSLDEVKSHYEKNDLGEHLREHIKEQKLFKLIYDAAKIKTGKKAKFLELTKENQ
jgi:trigger factor